MFYDITRMLTPTTATWPGDTPYGVQTSLKIAEGAAVNLTALHFSPHVGTHADAYFHYDDEGSYPAAMPLAAYIGRARVVTVVKRHGALNLSDFAGVELAGGERLLIHSHISDLPDENWTNEFPFLSVELIKYLATLNYRLVGLDSPSVDAFESKDLPCHHALRQNGMVNLENVALRGVPDGDYELIALPLKLDAACGSPVRAILRTL